MVLMVLPAELQQMVVTGVNQTAHCCRYPRGNGYGVPDEEGWEARPS